MTQSVSKCPTNRPTRPPDARAGPASPGCLSLPLPLDPFAPPARTCAGRARALGDSLLALLLAPACAACGQPLDQPSAGPVCAACWAAVRLLPPPLCDRCGEPVVHACQACGRSRETAGESIVRSRAVGPYEGSLRAILHALKYDSRRSVARPLGILLARSGADVVDGADLAIPVPLHRAKLRRRGFNQAEDLARRLPVPLCRGLVRLRDTPSQTSLPAAERRTNVAGAFGLAPGARIQGAAVLLVDDVSTTGATLEACARVLLDGGAREVRALTAARVARTAR